MEILHLIIILHSNAIRRGDEEINEKKEIKMIEVECEMCHLLRGAEIRIIEFLKGIQFISVKLLKFEIGLAYEKISFFILKHFV